MCEHCICKHSTCFNNFKEAKSNNVAICFAFSNVLRVDTKVAEWSKAIDILNDVGSDIFDHQLCYISDAGANVAWRQQPHSFFCASSSGLGGPPPLPGGGLREQYLDIFRFKPEQSSEEEGLAHHRHNELQRVIAEALTADKKRRASGGTGSSAQSPMML